MQDYVVENEEILIEKREYTADQILSRFKEYTERSTLDKAGKEDK